MTCPRCNSNLTYKDEDSNIACLYCGYRPIREITPADRIVKGIVAK